MYLQIRRGGSFLPDRNRLSLCIILAKCSTSQPILAFKIYISFKRTTGGHQLEMAYGFSGRNGACLRPVAVTDMEKLPFFLESCNKTAKS